MSLKNWQSLMMLGAVWRWLSKPGGWSRDSSPCRVIEQADNVSVGLQGEPSYYTTCLVTRFEI